MLSLWTLRSIRLNRFYKVRSDPRLVIFTGDIMTEKEIETLMPGILNELSKCLLSLSGMHDQGLVHGDV